MPNKKFSDPPTSQGRSAVRRAIHAQLCGLGLFVAGVLLVSRIVPIESVLHTLEGYVATVGWWAPVLFLVAFALCNITLLPGGVLAVGAGLFFGVWVGWSVTLAGSFLAAVIATGLTRRFARDRVGRCLRSARWRALDRAITRDGWRMVFFSQVHPLFPTSLLNYFYGVTAVPLRTCLSAILCGQAPGLLLYAYAGSLTGRGLKLANKGSGAWTDLIPWIAGMLLTLWATIALARVAVRIMRAVEEEADKESSMLEISYDFGGNGIPHSAALRRNSVSGSTT
jgi:uncharacterized membrane protein YdjX (TVP38/TMEM64 family)